MDLTNVPDDVLIKEMLKRFVVVQWYSVEHINEMREEDSNSKSELTKDDLELLNDRMSSDGVCDEVREIVKDVVIDEFPVDEWVSGLGVKYDLHIFLYVEHKLNIKWILFFIIFLLPEKKMIDLWI